MKFIIDPQRTADDMARIHLGDLVPIQGGANTSAILVDGEGIVVQLPKCRMKNGIIQTSKKMYCDLEFGNVKDAMVCDWFDALEERCIALMGEKCGEWFGSKTTMVDIEDSMGTNVRVERKSDNFTIRTTVGGSPSMRIQYSDPCVVFNRIGTELSLDRVTNETTIIPLVMIKCVKITTSGIDIELQLTQVMVIDDAVRQIDVPDDMVDPVTDGVGTPTTQATDGVGTPTTQATDGVGPPTTQATDGVGTPTTQATDGAIGSATPSAIGSATPSAIGSATPSAIGRATPSAIGSATPSAIGRATPSAIGRATPSAIGRAISAADTTEYIETPHQPIDTSGTSGTSGTSELSEVNIDINDISETHSTQIMESKEVRMKLYKEAKARALAARRRAIEEIMRAKNIKMEFQLDDEIDSDDSDEFDTGSEYSEYSSGADSVADSVADSGN
jgi:hypothetical protein